MGNALPDRELPRLTDFGEPLTYSVTALTCTSRKECHRSQCFGYLVQVLSS